MNETQTIQLVKSDREVAVNLVVSAVALGIFYCAVNPKVIDDVMVIARRRWNGFLYWVSVWAADRAIKSLPEVE